MPVSVRFALRSPKKGQSYANPHPLEVWITVNGQRTHFGAVWPVGHGAKLQVDPGDWDVKKQRSSRRDDPVSKKLNALRAHIEAIFDQQCLLGEPVIGSVVYELTEGKTPEYAGGRWLVGEPEKVAATAITAESGLLTVYSRFVGEVQRKRGASTARADRADVSRWERGLFLLEEWARQIGRPVPTCSRVTLSWLRDYHTWLVGQPGGKAQDKPISPGQASRYIGKIGKVLQWMVDDELISHNSAKKTTWPRYNDKEIFFLEPEQVQHLFTLNWSGTAGVALWWFLLMCCTGLDYPDARAYARRRGSLERSGPAGPKLYGRRMKPPHEVFDVPLLEEVERLFERHPVGPAGVTANCVNRHTADIEVELSITEWRITSKTARKTFACLMLINGYYIGEVSRMLGHKHTSTTEKHYARFLSSGVDRGRSRVGKDSLL